MPVKKTKPKKGDLKKRKNTPKHSVAKEKAFVKKLTKKKKATKKSTKIIGQEKIDKKEIKKAVEKLPGMIIEQIKMEDADEMKMGTIPQITKIEELLPIKKSEEKTEQDFYDGKDRKWIMWLGVIIFTTIIFIVWSWSLSVKFQDTFKSNKPGVFENAKDDLGVILEKPVLNQAGLDEKKDENAEIKTESTPATSTGDIKEKLKQRLNSLFSNPSSTASSSFFTSSSSIENIDAVSTTTNNFKNDATNNNTNDEIISI